jgi:hypothetical protein
MIPEKANFATVVSYDRKNACKNPATKFLRFFLPKFLSQLQFDDFNAALVHTSFPGMEKAMPKARAFLEKKGKTLINKLVSEMKGATTLSIMTLCITALSIMTLSITTLSITTLA